MDIMKCSELLSRGTSVSRVFNCATLPEVFFSLQVAVASACRGNANFCGKVDVAQTPVKQARGVLARVQK